MADERARQGRSQAATVDTDAVCERCGTVNPEETLLCKSCGNNLREQRSRRMAAAQNYEGIEEPKRRTRWLAHLLGVFGLLVILWTALHVAEIETWLVQAQSSDTDRGEDFYEGPRAATLNQMSADLIRNPVNESQLGLAMAQTANPSSLEGRYAIVRRGLAGPEMVGQAIVRRDGGDLLFVAKLENGVELRGAGRSREGSDDIMADDVGIEYNGEYADASGILQPAAGVGYTVYGITSLNEDSYEGTVYAVPENAEAVETTEAAPSAEPAEAAETPEAAPASEAAPSETPETPSAEPAQ